MLIGVLFLPYWRKWVLDSSELIRLNGVSLPHASWSWSMDPLKVSSKALGG